MTKTFDFASIDGVRSTSISSACRRLSHSSNQATAAACMVATLDEAIPSLRIR
jgi:hypothetical protein